MLRQGSFLWRPQGSFLFRPKGAVPRARRGQTHAPFPHQAELNRKEAEHTQETTRLKNRIAWQNHLIGCLSFLLLKTSDIFRKAVNGIIRLAKDYYKPRFDTEQVSDIKDAPNLFGDDRQSHRAAGDFLYLTAKQKGDLDSREQIKAKQEVDNVVDGHYDYQQKRGFSIRR